MLLNLTICESQISVLSPPRKALKKYSKKRSSLRLSSLSPSLFSLATAHTLTLMVFEFSFCFRIFPSPSSRQITRKMGLGGRSTKRNESPLLFPIITVPAPVFGKGRKTAKKFSNRYVRSFTNHFRKETKCPHSRLLTLLDHKSIRLINPKILFLCFSQKMFARKNVK